MPDAIENELVTIINLVTVIMGMTKPAISNKELITNSQRNCAGELVTIFV